MKIVVDTNIVFSAILNSKSKIGHLLINGTKFFEFYSTNLLKDEIRNHIPKILSISTLTDSQLHSIIQAIFTRIKFIDDVFISDDELNKAVDLVSEIDENDALFVAISIHLNARLWSGDKKLIKGLTERGYSKTFTTEELFNVYLKKLIPKR